MSIFDWPPRENLPSPRPDLASSFQSSLNDIAGFAPGGFPRLRLFWGQEMREGDRYPEGAGSFSSAHFMEHRYSVRVVNQGWVAHFPEGDRTYPPSIDVPEELVEEAKKYSQIIEVEEKRVELDIGIPRWYVHQWRPSTPIDAATYDSDRFAYSIEDNELLSFSPPTLPPGQWSQVVHIVISEHEGGCCARAKGLGTKCFANYREPSQIDLDYLASIWKEKERMPVRFSEGEICPPWIIEQRTRARLGEIEDAKQRAGAKRRFWLNSIFKENQHRIFSNPKSGYNVATGKVMPVGKNVR